jgi:hypothetical protein
MSVKFELKSFSLKVALARLLLWFSLCYFLYLLTMLIGMFAVSYAGLLSWFRIQYPDAYLLSDYSKLYFTESHYKGVRLAAPFLSTHKKQTPNCSSF